MLKTLNNLMNKSIISPLSYYFARFITEQNNQNDNETLTLTAALISERNLKGDVCIDLNSYAGQPLFEDTQQNTFQQEKPEPILGYAFDDWQQNLMASTLVGKTASDQQPFILNENRLYLRKHYLAEQTISKAIQQSLAIKPNIDTEKLKHGLDVLFKPSEEKKDQNSEAEVDWQKLACATALTHKFTVISGGPGTGKTTTIIKVLTLLLNENSDMKIQLAAPTGKAAARMSDSISAGLESDNKIKQLDETIIEKIPTEAQTLHRLLGYTGHAFRYNNTNKLVVDCLVIDEASMIDQAMMTRILDAIQDDTHLILLGDRDQLASVEAGNVLSDITGQGVELAVSEDEAHALAELTNTPVNNIPHNNNLPPIANSIALLQKSFRFDDNSGIGKLSRLINHSTASNNKSEEAFTCLSSNKDGIHWIPCHNQNLNSNNKTTLNTKVITTAVSRYEQFLHEKAVGKAYELFESFRVLCALKKGEFGVENLNEQIELALIKQGLIDGGNSYHKMPIMITVNDYENSLFNGDIGLIWKDKTSGELKVYFKFSDKQRSVPLSLLSDYVPAWALSVHKSQGSEFEEVLLVLPDDADSPILSKELIYTGVTRAKKTITIHTSKETFINSCQTKVERTTGLASQLGWC